MPELPEVETMRRAALNIRVDRVAPLVAILVLVACDVLVCWLAGALGWRERFDSDRVEMLALGLASVQAALVAVWGALAPARWFVRYPGAGIGAFILCLAITTWEGVPLIFPLAVFLLALGLLSLLRALTGWRLCVPPWVKSPGRAGFSIATMLVWLSIAAGMAAVLAKTSPAGVLDNLRSTQWLTRADTFAFCLYSLIVLPNLVVGFWILSPYHAPVVEEERPLVRLLMFDLAYWALSANMRWVYLILAFSIALPSIGVSAAAVGVCAWWFRGCGYVIDRYDDQGAGTQDLPPIPAFH